MRRCIEHNVDILDGINFFTYLISSFFHSVVSVWPTYLDTYSLSILLPTLPVPNPYVAPRNKPHLNTFNSGFLTFA